ncbi:hypothetical protein MED134_03804 [Dokdonia sp. MED134]|uniref:hypothetical protein n=1 Tax=Dokdonia sp. MED134 TaxID=313590 RepID=UPI0000689B9D|nr:hypothetical protein [Dokdonia sp. MED134]EAQ38406.1 hypothetical protein MED134_03804 [Dokdonia sp. MED134]
MKKIYFIILVGILTACSDDEKAIEVVTEEIERGAVLRNINRIENNFEAGDLTSAFAVEVEEQDEEDGALLDFVRVYTKYIDRDVSNGNDTSPEIILKDIEASSFTTGPVGLPRHTLNVSYEETVTAHNLDLNAIQPGDQFEVRLEVFLTDGRSYSNDSGSASILTDFCFFKSPYRYVINVIEPIPDADFTGTYFYEIISDQDDTGVNSEGFITINSTSMSNVRYMPLFTEGVEFTIAGTSIYPKIYGSYNGFCRDSTFHILTGPGDTSFGQVNLIDDTVFDMTIVIGYEGWDGQLGNNVREFTYRFTKQ